MKYKFQTTDKYSNDHAVIFDFDCTLTCVHAWYLFNYFAMVKNSKNINQAKILDEKTFIEKLSLQQVINNLEPTESYASRIIFGNKKRIKMLADMFKSIKQYKYSIMIASRNNLKLIVYLLKQAGLFDYFDIIKGSDMVYTNGRYLQTLLSPTNNVSSYKATKDDFIYRLTQNGFDKIIYLDDDPEEFFTLTKSVQCTVTDVYNIKVYECPYRGKNLIFIHLENEGPGIDSIIKTILVKALS